MSFQNKTSLIVPYESYAIKQTHLVHLYQLCQAFELETTLPNNARVLELACASGGNLIPLAFYYPNSNFLGIDIAFEDIKHAKKTAQELALTNVQFLAESILDYKSQDKYDYIICHGLYSWVEEPIRESIFRIFKNNLNDNGIAYISYNTYPAWAIGNIVRHLMLEVVKENPSNPLLYVHKFIDALAKSLEKPQTPFDILLSEEVKLVASHSDNQLQHEHLNTAHHPVYFHEFIVQAKQHGFNYICDATFFEFEENIFDVTYSQQQDLLQNRRFRSSLLTKQIVSAADVNQLNLAYGFLNSQINKNPQFTNKPSASLLARVQAMHAPLVTNLYHENILLTEIAHEILPLLDGTHTITDLEHVIDNMIKQNTFVLVDQFQQPITDPSLQEKQITFIINETLMLLAKRYIIE